MSTDLLPETLRYGTMLPACGEKMVINNPNEMKGFDELLKGLEWIDAKVRPPEPGLIVKRWKKPHGWSHWAGYFNGDVKMASCDFWLALPE